jgi:hypothetical protein
MDLQANQSPRKLTFNQRRKLSQVMGQYESMLVGLVASVKDVGEMRTPGEKLTQNLDFKKKLLSYHERFRLRLIDLDLMLPVFEHAERNAISSAEMIVAGQSRSDVRHWIDRYRCDLFFGLELDTQNVIFDCYRWGEKVHEAFNR